MRKIFFFSTGILLCLAGWAVYAYMKPHRNVANEKTNATVSAFLLYNDFKQDEAGADKKWIGKIIEITGTVTSIIPAGIYTSINLKAAIDGGINCNVLSSDLSGEKSPFVGETLTIKGKCTGFLLDVNLVDCIITNQSH